MMHCEIRDLTKRFQHDGRRLPVLDGIHHDGLSWDARPRRGPLPRRHHLLISMRPARIREVIANSFAAPRGPSVRSTSEFVSRKDRLLSLIRAEAAIQKEN